MEKRSYDQYCAMARALDVIGHRWTLLLVRELLTGPKRHKDLLGALAGIGTNLLAARLKELTAAGLIHRSVLPPPAGSTVYELTGRGAALKPVVLALAQWGLELLGEKTPKDRFQPSWSLLSMQVIFQPKQAWGLKETYQFHVDDEVFHVRVQNGELTTAQGVTADPHLEIHTDQGTFLDFAFRRITPERAVKSGAMRIKGEMERLKRLLHLFTLPAQI